MAAPVPVHPRNQASMSLGGGAGVIEAAARSSGRAGATGRRDLPEPASSLGVKLCQSARRSEPASMS